MYYSRDRLVTGPVLAYLMYSLSTPLRLGWRNLRNYGAVG